MATLFGQAGKVLKVLYPNGINTDQYDDLLCLLRILDKLFRIAQRGKVIEGESPYLDIAGYGLLGCVKDKKNKERNNK